MCLGSGAEPWLSTNVFVVIVSCLFLFGFLKNHYSSCDVCLKTLILVDKFLLWIKYHSVYWNMAIEYVSQNVGIWQILFLAEKQLFQYSLTICLFLRYSMLHFSPEVSMLLRKFIHTGSFIQPTTITVNFLYPKSLSDFPLVTVTTHCIYSFNMVVLNSECLKHSLCEVTRS